MARKTVAIHRQDLSISHYVSHKEANDLVASGQYTWDSDFKAAHKIKGENFPWKIRQSGKDGPLTLQLVTR